MKNTAFAAAFIAAVALAACTKTEKTQETTVASADTAVVIETDTTPLASGKSAGWNDLDYNMPEVRVPTIRLPQVTVHANEHLASYALGDNILFKLDEATLSKEGASDLKSVADNIEERLPGSQIRIYGYADTTGSKAYNKDLSMKRADIVKQYLIGDCKISADRISTQAMGERNPIPGAPDASDRRVVIVAREK